VVGKESVEVRLGEAAEEETVGFEEEGLCDHVFFVHGFHGFDGLHGFL
jgi:hypothetical protein